MYMNDVPGKKYELCPFRAFIRKSFIHAHLKNHKSENICLADIRSPQLNLIRALYDYRRSVSFVQPLVPETPDLLRKSACLIKKWNARGTENTFFLLEKKNRQILAGLR